jgi:hypothetical protein
LRHVEAARKTLPIPKKEFAFMAPEYVKPMLACQYHYQYGMLGSMFSWHEIWRTTWASSSDHPDQPCAEGGKKRHERPFQQSAQQAAKQIFAGDHAQTSSKNVTASKDKTLLFLKRII